MKTNQKKRLTVASAVIAALGIYNQSAVAINLTNPNVGAAYAIVNSDPNEPAESQLFSSITIEDELYTTATVGLIVKNKNIVSPSPFASPSMPFTITATSNITTTTRNVLGAAIYGESSLDLGSNSIITSAGAGVLVFEKSKLIADKLTINAGGLANNDYYADDRTALGISNYSEANLGQDSKISMTGKSLVSGITIATNGSLKAEALEVNVTLTEPNTSTNSTHSGVQINSGNVSLGSNSKIVTTGVNGVYISNIGGLATDPLNFKSIDNLYIEVTDTTNPYGLNAAIRMSNGGTAKLEGTTTIKMIGDHTGQAVGLASTKNATRDTLFDADKLIIDIDRNDAIYVTSSGSTSNFNAIATIGAGSIITAKDTTTGLLASGNRGFINYNGTASNRNSINAQRPTGSLIANNLSGAWAASQGTINLKYTDIALTGEVLSGQSNLIGLYANTEGIINADNVTIRVNDSANARYGVLAKSDAKIDLIGDTVINVKDGIAIGTDIETYYSSSKIYGTTSGSVTGNGKMTITGDLFASGSNALIDLKMQPDSLFTGGSSINPTKKGTINLALTDSKWDMTKDSEATNLIVNNSTVTFSEQKVGSTLTVANLSGNNGTFNMMVDVPALKSDLLIVTGTSAGAHHINALNQGGAATTGTEIIPMVQTKDGAATFDLANQVELGGYVYGLRRTPSDTTDWELYSSGPVVDPVNPITPIVDPTNPTNPTPRSNISTTADASANFLNSAYLMNYAETQTLLQRMGELRQADNSQGDAWVRAYSGKFDSFDGGKLSGFDMSYTGAQLGADKRLSVEGGDLYLGGMVGFAEADPKFTSGDGSLKSYNLGIYATYVAENDFYVDGVLKYTHIKNSFNNVKDTQGNITSGDTSSDGYGISLEAGKRFYLQQPKSGFYIEPQAQISFSHLGGSSTTASNGLVTSIDSFDSTLGRLSALIGYEVKDGANPMNVYFKTGVVTEMSGNSNYALNGSKESNDFGGSWWENGIGLTAQINKQHNLYVEGTYSTGSRFDQMQINAGYRYSF